MAKTYDELGNYGVQYKRIDVENCFTLPIKTIPASDSVNTDDGAMVYVDGLGADPEGGYMKVNGAWQKFTADHTAFFTNGGNSFGAPAILGTNDANYLALEANNTEAMRIFSSTQNIRIGGTTDNGDKLSVNGTIHATGSGGVSFRITSGTAIRSDGTIYIDALNYTEGIINLRYGLGLSGEANFNNNGARLNQLHAVGSRLSGNYLANSSTISRGLEFRSEENSGNNYVNLRPTYYATAGTFTDYAWIVLADQGKGVIIGSQYKNATSDILQVTGNINLTTAGNKIRIKSGTNSSVGTATLVGGTVTVNTTAVTANSIVIYNRATTGGTVGHLSYTKVANTSITFNSDSATDTSTIDYIIIDAY